MIGKWYSLLSILQAVVSEEWTANIQQEVKVRKGLCAHIRCQYSYPSRLAKDQRVGIWFNTENLHSQSRIAFHSKDSNRVMPRYHHRTWFSGNLSDNDCSLNINNVTQEDEGPYYFRIEFKGSDCYSYHTITKLRVDVSGQSEVNTPRVVTAQRGLCALIPCQYKSDGARDGIWLKDECSTETVIFNSSDPNRKSPGFHRRTQLSGDVKNGNCSLIIDNVTEKDEGTYYFKTEFGKGEQFVSITQLRITVLEERRANTPRAVTAQRGLCARIPCHYSSLLHDDNKTWDGIWMKDECLTQIVTAHSTNHSQVSPMFQLRSRLSGKLKDGDCSLVIDNIMQEDEGYYYFKIASENMDRHCYLPTTQLHVIDFTDKPSIFPAEMVAGKPVNVSCTFNSSCCGSTPSFTWIMPSNVLALNSSSVTEWADTLTYASVLTFIPALRLHGQNFTCRVKYPSVSSEQTVTLTVLSPPAVEYLVVSLAAAGVVVALFILVTLTCFILQSRRRTNRPDGNRGKPEDKSEIMFVRDRLKMEEHYYSNCAQPELAQGKAKKDPEYNWNENEDHNVYANSHYDEDSIYANM